MDSRITEFSMPQPDPPDLLDVCRKLSERLGRYSEETFMGKWHLEPLEEEEQGYWRGQLLLAIKKAEEAE